MIRKLFEPIQIKTMQLENRILLTAMVTRLSGEDGYVNRPILDRYLRFARGETGLIVVEATAVHGAKSGPLLRLSDASYIPGHQELTRRIHAESHSKVALQIIHFLKIARSGWRQTVDMLSHNDIRLIVQQYGDAAVRTREAGYDAVELHMAHAYTMSSFLSKRNARSDEYGGRSLETRMRAMTEVILQVRQKVGSDFPIGVRFDGEECIKGGYGLSESKYMALRMAQLGVDYISISAGGKFEDAVKKEDEPLYPYTGYSGDRTMPPAEYQDGANIYLAAGIKAFVNAHGYPTPIVTTGKIPTPQLAEEILQNGQADIIGFARALLADPDWPKKAQLGQDERIVRCVYGNVCKALDENFKQVKCTLWLKQGLHPPEPPPEGDESPPTWPGGGQLQATRQPNGRVLLAWERAADPQGVYGYEIFRAVNGGRFVHLTSATTNRHADDHALAGNSYAYLIKAYDFAGNRSGPSNVAEVEIPPPVAGAEARTLRLDGEVEAQMGYTA